MRRSRRERLATLLSAPLLRQTLERVGRWRGVLVLNYHRVGDSAGQPWDRTLWSASAHELDAQLATLARHAEVIDPERLEQCVHAGARGRRVLITFDDGYRDNYEIAFPLLRKHRLSATFFLATDFLDRPHVAWWDEIAWLVRHAPAGRPGTGGADLDLLPGGVSSAATDRDLQPEEITSAAADRDPQPEESAATDRDPQPEEITSAAADRDLQPEESAATDRDLVPEGVSLTAADRDASIATLVGRYKQLPDGEGERLLEQLAQSSGGRRCEPTDAEELWMSWEMAREMQAAGMAIGGHTVSHPVLARLPRERQEEEIATCARRLREELGASMRWFAYPVGSPDTFTKLTKELLRDHGAELAFSFYGGLAGPGRWDPLDVPRVHVGPGLTPALLAATISLPALFVRR